MRKHLYLFVCAAVSFAMVLIYTEICQHRKRIITYDSHDNDWVDIFKNQDISEDKIKFISHDDDIWYYKGKSTCIAYGENPLEFCDYKLAICSGGKIPYTTFGNKISQVQKVIDFTKKGTDKLCPVIYSGAD